MNDKPTVRAPAPSAGVLDDETQRALGVDPDDARQATLVKALARRLQRMNTLTAGLPGRISGKTVALKGNK